MIERKASKIRGLAWIALGCGIAAIIALGIRPLAHAVPWRWERSLGRTLAEAENPTLCSTSNAVRAVRAKLIQRIYPQLPGDRAVDIRVAYVRNSQINAFATLGGRIYVYSGLIAKAESAEALAGVIAHETAHVTNRHVMEAAISQIFTRAGMQFILTGDAGRLAEALWSIDFSRAQEAEADDFAYRRLQAAHVDNRPLKNFFMKTLKRPEYLSYLDDHPSSSERVRIGDRYANTNVTPILTTAEWQLLKNACRTNDQNDPAEPHEPQ